MKNSAIGEDYRRDGYVVVPSVFPPDEVERLRDHYMRLRALGSFPGDSAGVDVTSNDPLKRYPRMIHMHRWDETSLRWLLDPRLNEWLTFLLGREPYAVQTMAYFKPPGARGQALHQDQAYLQVQPGTCMAAWMALDPCDEENGCIRIGVGSSNLPELCTQAADTQVSFTDSTVPLPRGMAVVPVIMEPGDVLFFNGSVIHGSYPNVSRDRFRCALIGHYAVGDAEKIGEFYHPVLRMDGSEAALEISDGGGPCGVWVEEDGRPVVEMRHPAEPRLATHE